MSASNGCTISTACGRTVCSPECAENHLQEGEEAKIIAIREGIASAGKQAEQKMRKDAQRLLIASVGTLKTSLGPTSGIVDSRAARNYTLSRMAHTPQKRTHLLAGYLTSTSLCTLNLMGALTHILLSRYSNGSCSSSLVN